MAITARLITTGAIIAGTKIVIDATLGKDGKRGKRRKSLIGASKELKKRDKLIR